MKAILPFFIALLLVLPIMAQDSLSFPATWVGKWSGELEIHDATGLRQQIYMSLHIQPTDSAGLYAWDMTYGQGEEAQVRNYFLKTIDAEFGHYAVDEANSIVLDAYWRNGVLYEIFSVNGSLLITTTEQVSDDELFWKIIVSRTEPISTTGGEEVDGEMIPEVNSFLVPAVQQARLKRE